MKKIPMAKAYENHDLATSWKRLSRHEWKHRYQYRSARSRRLEAARDRRHGGCHAVLCDCDD